MKNLSGKIVTSVAVLLVVVSAMSTSSCRDKFMTEVDTVRDTTTQFDTTIRRDTTILHDTTLRFDTFTSAAADWHLQPSGTNTGLNISQFLDASNGVIAGNFGTLLWTTNAGALWNSLPANGPVGVGASMYGIKFFDAMNGFAIGDNSIVWHTTDGGQNWTSITLATGFFLRSLCFLDSLTGFIGTSDPGSSPPGLNGEIWRTQNGGKNWTRIKTISPGSVYNIQFTSRLNGIATGKFSTVLWTSDGGATWNPGSTDVASAHITHTAMFADGMMGFAAATEIFPGTTESDSVHGHILKTTDGGRTWHAKISTSYGMQGIATNGDGVITAAGFFGSILESEDGGKSWNHYAYGFDRWLDVQYISPTRCIMVGTSGKILSRNH